MAKPVILAVDDDPQVLRAVERDLRRRYAREYRILRADSGESALDTLGKLKLRGDPVALFLVDQRMPKMTGVEFLEGAIERYPEAKRALLTAYSDTEAAIRAINEVGLDYYLQKPWDPPEQNLYPNLDDMLGDWQANYRPPFTGLRVVGDRWSPESHRTREFLALNRVPYRWLDVEGSEEAREILANVDSGAPKLPLVVYEDGSYAEAPQNREIAEKIGLKTRAGHQFYDLVIVGGGPSGLAAAVYGASEGLKTVLIEREAPGGQAGTSSRIENYLGFPAGLSGGDLARRAVDQAKRFDVEILTPQEVSAIRDTRGGHLPHRDPRRWDGDLLLCPDHHDRCLLPKIGCSGYPTPHGTWHLLRRGPDRGHLVQGRGRIHRRRCELGRSGRDVLRKPGAQDLHSLQGRRPEEEHVRLPSAPDRSQRRYRGAPRHKRDLRGG
jgi:thioredoxin reductase (NADPH)